MFDGTFISKTFFKRSLAAAESSKLLAAATAGSLGVCSAPPKAGAASLGAAGWVEACCSGAPPAAVFGSGFAFSTGLPSASSVLRKSAASGTSRMLARLSPDGPLLAMRDDLLGQISIGLSGHSIGVVLQNRHAFYGCLSEAN